MNLPANLTILPGVRSDHRGRRYRMGQYPSGKQVPIPYQEDPHAERANLIPAVEPQMLRLEKLPEKLRRAVEQGRKGETLTRDAKGNLIVARHKARRLSVAEYRYKKENDLHKLVLSQDNPDEMSVYQAMVNSGRATQVAEDVVVPGTWDWFVQYHIDEEVK